MQSRTGSARELDVARVLVIPGLDGDTGLVRAAAPRLFRGIRPVPFDHRLDALAGGVEGLAERALAVLDADSDADAPAFVCGESFGGTAPLTLARRHPERVRGLILLSAFGWYPSVFGGDWYTDPDLRRTAGADVIASAAPRPGAVVRQGRAQTA